MEDQLGKVAAGLLLERVLAEEDCHVFHLDLICDDVVTELASVVISMPRTFRRRCMRRLRSLVVLELNSLMRRGMIRFSYNERRHWVEVEVRAGIGPTVREMLKVLD